MNAQQPLINHYGGPLKTTGRKRKISKKDREMNALVKRIAKTVTKRRIHDESLDGAVESEEVNRAFAEAKKRPF
jgi:hypothetical protein